MTEHLRSERRFRFDVTREDLWTAIAAVEHYPRWWPWLRRFHAEGLVAGDRWHATVQPPLPYSLAFTIDLRRVDEGQRVDADIDGDIGGTATLCLLDVGRHGDPDGGGLGCEACLTSELAPRSRLLRTAARVAAPVVRFGHDWVLDTGARQFVGRAL